MEIRCGGGRRGGRGEEEQRASDEGRNKGEALDDVQGKGGRSRAQGVEFNQQLERKVPR